jgi:hypothetical protein
VTTMLGFIVLVAVSIHLAPQLTRRESRTSGPAYVTRAYSVSHW